MWQFHLIFGLFPMIIRFPIGSGIDLVGGTHDNAASAKKIIDNLQPGGMIAMPSTRDAAGRYLWDVQYPVPYIPEYPWPIACDLTDDPAARSCLRALAADVRQSAVWRVLCDRMAELGFTKQEAFFRGLADGIDAIRQQYGEEGEAMSDESHAAMKETLSRLFGRIA